MQFNEDNTINMGMNVDAEITVFNNSEGYVDLHEAYMTKEPIESPMSRFGYDGDFLVVDYISHLINGKASTQFELRMVEGES